MKKSTEKSLLFLVKVIYVVINTKIFAGTIFSFGIEEINFEDKTLNFQIDTEVEERALKGQENNKKNLCCGFISRSSLQSKSKIRYWFRFRL